MTTTKRPVAIPGAAVEAGMIDAFGPRNGIRHSEDVAYITSILAAAYPAIREAIMQEVADFALKEYTETRKDRIFAESLAYHLTIKGIDAVTEDDDDDQ